MYFSQQLFQKMLHSHLSTFSGYIKRAVICVYRIPAFKTEMREKEYIQHYRRLDVC